MAQIKPHRIYIDDEAGKPTNQTCAIVHPASQHSVNLVLAQDENNDDGRSNWLWVRLQNGDLILGVYPQGLTYERVEADAAELTGV